MVWPRTDMLFLLCNPNPDVLVWPGVDGFYLILNRWTYSWTSSWLKILCYRIIKKKSNITRFWLNLVPYRILNPDLILNFCPINNVKFRDWPNINFSQDVYTCIDDNSRNCETFPQKTSRISSNLILDTWHKWMFQYTTIKGECRID